MTKEEMALFYNAVLVALLIMHYIVVYFKNKNISKLNLEIEQLDTIYFDEIKALESLVPKEKRIDFEKITKS